MSNSSNAEVIAEIVSVSQITRTDVTITMSIAALLIYDALLCMDKEVEYVWCSPKASRKLSRFLYLYNSCTALDWLTMVLEVLSLVGPAAVIVTWRRTRTARQSTQVLRRSSLEQILWDNGNVYFCALVSLNIANMTLITVTTLSQPSDVLNYLIVLVDPTSSILNSRFLLSLYETNIYLERGGGSASSFSSTLDFGEADRARSPELPEFLSSLAGPIHSIPDDDPARFDFEPTPQPTPEIEREAIARQESADLEGGAETQPETEYSNGDVEVSERGERTCQIRTQFCTQFAFLDHHHIVVASDNGTELRVYTIHPDRPPSIVPSNPASPDDSSTRIFLLPPVKDGTSIQIDELSSQRAPSSRPGCAAAFEHNTQLTIMAITFIVSTGNIGYRYMLLVPTSALLGAYTCNTGSQLHTDENRGAVPWEAWGAPCSRLFRFDTRGHGRWGASMCAMSSRSLFINRRWSQHNQLTILDILVVELRPWARQYGAVDVETDPLAEYVNTRDALLAPEELEPKESIHQRLLFCVVRRMVVAYGGEVDSNKYNSFLALLPDGVALINNGDTENTQSMLHLFAA
ncbi:hypothetical protein VTO73DRAFT_11700 [Trametes versicolor]